MVSTCEARPSSGASWLTGMSVATADLSAVISCGRRGMRSWGSACSRRDSSTRCWRAPRSKSLEPCRDRAYRSASAPFMCWMPLGMYTPSQLVVGRREAVVGDRNLDVDRHPAHHVDDLLEAVEVDLDEVLDVEAVEVAHDRLEAVEAAGLLGARRRDRSGGGRWSTSVDLVAIGGPEDLPGRAGRDRHVHGVARQAEHRDLLGDRVDRDDDQGVGVEGAVARRWSAPISRMLRRSLPSHGGIDTSGRADPTGVLAGFGRRGRLGRAGLGRGRRQAGRRRRRVEIALPWSGRSRKMQPLSGSPGPGRRSARRPRGCRP